jgi:glutamine synthetase
VPFSVDIGRATVHAAPDATPHPSGLTEEERVNVRDGLPRPTPEVEAEIERTKQRLIDEGVRYVLGNWVDVHGRGKAKAVPIESFEKAMGGSELYTVGAMDGMGPLGPHEDECAALPDLQSLTVCPWDRRYAWMASDLWWHGAPYAYDSRYILKRVLAEARGLGYAFNAGFEPEFYVLRKGDDGELLPFHPEDKGAQCPGYDLESMLDSMPLLERLISYLDELGWGLYSFDHEGGHSQYELDFGFTDALACADRYIFLRLLLKETAKQYGAFVTFMPKPFSDDFGSGAHYNISLADAKTGENLFRDEDDPQGLGFSQLAYNFVGGVLRHAEAITAVTSPTVNSYKRLVRQGHMYMISWAPSHVAYGANNRSCMLRLPASRPCVENRASDMSGNMYLGLAITLAAGLEGIKEGIDPGPAVTGDLFTTNQHPVTGERIETLPRTMLDAIRAFDADPLSDRVFGPLKSVYTQVKLDEWDAYHSVVSQWERDYYLHLF